MTTAHDRLVDEHDIVQTALRYCRALDTKNWASLGDVFVADATADLVSGGLLEGLDAIENRVRTALGHLDASQHLVANHAVDVDGDDATHFCYLQAQHVRKAAAGTDGSGANYIVAGHYDDVLARTDHGWRITHRTLTVVWTDGNVAVVRG